jgi:hypothetical protein
MAGMPFLPFPVDDVAAARAWLEDRSNYDFEEWESAIVEKSDKWVALETVLSAVTGWTPHRVRKMVKDIIPHHVPVENLTTRVSLAQRKRVAEEATAVIMDGIDVGWKDEAEEWLVGALTVFARKAIQLWKKGLSRKVSKSDSGEGGAEREPPAKRRNVNAGSDGIRKSCSRDREKALPGGNDGTTGTSRFHESSHKLSWHPQRLDDCEIEVSMNDGTCISVATAAILMDSKGDCSGTELRIERLDYERVKAIISAMGDSWDGDRGLWWCEDEALIHDQEDFINAIGVLLFHLDKLCLEWSEGASGHVYPTLSK